ncbi:MAG: GTP-binding protein, partial [Promethearchaeota archaeon]
MQEREEKEFSRIKELESTNLATDEIRDQVIQTKKEVEKNNKKLAEQLNRKFKTHNIKSYDIVGAIGAGKTAILERISEKLGLSYRIFVICGDITTRVDANRIEQHNAETIQINTGRECA